MSALSPVSMAKASVTVFLFLGISLCVSMYVNSCVGVFGVHMCATCVRYLWRLTECVGLLGTGVKDACELPSRAAAGN